MQLAFSIAKRFVEPRFTVACHHKFWTLQICYRQNHPPKHADVNKIIPTASPLQWNIAYKYLLEQLHDKTMIASKNGDSGCLH